MRRIALVQLLRGTAMMSLPEIAGLLAGGGDDRDWRTTVRDRIAECEAQVDRLTAACSCLAHLLTCPSDSARRPR